MSAPFDSDLLNLIKDFWAQIVAFVVIIAGFTGLKINVSRINTALYDRDGNAKYIRKTDCDSRHMNLSGELRNINDGITKVHNRVDELFKYLLDSRRKK